MKEYRIRDSHGREHMARALPHRKVTHAVVAWHVEIPDKVKPYGLVRGQREGWRVSVHASAKIAHRVAAHAKAMGWASEVEVVKL